jgi:hypothetical protein
MGCRSDTTGSVAVLGALRGVIERNVQLSAGILCSNPCSAPGGEGSADDDVSVSAIESLQRAVETVSEMSQSRVFPRAKTAKAQKRIA